MLPIRIVKLGGSVLDQPDYARALDTWLEMQAPARTLVLVGGGRPVDAVRELAQFNPYPEDLLHWICIDLMDISFRLAASAMSQWSRIEDAQHLRTWCQSGSAKAIVHIRAFYDRSCDLPIGWQTTSDTLSAHLAEVVDARELVLIKSCSTNAIQSRSWQELADSGVVDAEFPKLVTRLSNCEVRIANFRE